MKAAAGLRAASAAALLLAGGCDYWNNLVDEKSLTRADLEFQVLDIWTGENLRDSDCRDSIRNLPIRAGGDGVFRLQAGPTGPYALRCGHEWYFPGGTNLGLTAAGAQLTLRLVRGGGSENWYSDPGNRVSIPRPPGDSIRYPVDWEWLATPADDSNRFWYEWTFLSNPNLDRGHQVGHQQLPKEAYSPRYRARIPGENGFKDGPDTVILNVYSLLNGAKSPYLAGSDTVAFRWVRNRRPYIVFPDSNYLPWTQVDCREPFSRLDLSLNWGDSDGACRTIRVWTSGAPSVARYDTLSQKLEVGGKYDTTLSCLESHASLKLWLGRPNQPGRPNPNAAGSEIYENAIVAEIMDDNNEISRNTVSFNTFTNAPPVATIDVPPYKGGYFAGDPIPFTVAATDTDGNLQLMTFFWSGKDHQANAALFFRPEKIPATHTSEFKGVVRFPIADTYTIGGTVQDNCSDQDRPDSLDIRVEENHEPNIKITEVEKNFSNDSMRVSFRLYVSDREANDGKDFIDSVAITWNGAQTEIYLNKELFIDGLPRSHTFPVPAPGSSVSVRIRAFDRHYGESGGDTTLRIAYP